MAVTLAFARQERAQLRAVRPGGFQETAVANGDTFREVAVVRGEIHQGYHGMGGRDCECCLSIGVAKRHTSTSGRDVGGLCELQASSRGHLSEKRGEVCGRCGKRYTHDLAGTET